jgi:hypothetical protein
MTSTPMAPYFVEQNMTGSAATHVSSLESNMTSASDQKLKNGDGSDKDGDGSDVSQKVKSGFKSLEEMNKINNVTFESMDWVTGDDHQRMESMINRIIRPSTANVTQHDCDPGRRGKGDYTHVRTKSKEGKKAEEADGRLQEEDKQEKVNNDIENVLEC